MMLWGVLLFALNTSIAVPEQSAVDAAPKTETAPETKTAAEPESEPALPPEPELLQIDREWEILFAPEDEVKSREAFKLAGEKLGDWKLDVAGADVTGQILLELSQTPIKEPILRALREKMGRPVDLEDFLFFIDDVLVAGNEGWRGKLITLTPGRARAAGIFIHPQEIFKKKKPRIYADGWFELNVEPPQEREKIVRAKNGDLLGSGWYLRYPNPYGEAGRFKALAKHNPSGTFHTRMKSLVKQLRAQGAYVTVESTLRRRERGYLMWGAFILSRADSEEKVEKLLRKLWSRKKRWGLRIPIRWRHPDGWEANIEAARQMAEAYAVVYATEGGARASNHYDGVAIDISAVGLPRKLRLKSPSGEVRIFNLSNKNQTRDLNLTPKLIDWINEYFEVEKLEMDYPHWDDKAPAKESEPDPSVPSGHLPLAGEE